MSKKAKLNGTVDQDENKADGKSVNVSFHTSQELILSSKAEMFDIGLYRQYSQVANDANANRKIFLIHGNYNPIRNGLLRRGWIEKIPKESVKYKELLLLPQYALVQKTKKGNEYEKVLLSSMVENFPAFFIWMTKAKYRDEYTKASPYRNKIRRGRDFNFCTKLGLIGCAETIQWCTQATRSELKCPRFHRLNLEEKDQFLEDFRITECFSLLSYLNDNGDDENNPLYSMDGLVQSDSIKFALDRVTEFVKRKVHADIDENLSQNDDHEWENFMTNSRLVIEQKAKLKCDEYDFMNYRVQIKKALKDVKPFWSTLQMDGYLNLWILKPGFSNRGNGIVIMRDFENIINHSKKYITLRYMVQKYIERPLLIYSTKFDIRQHVLLTLTENVNIWIYKDCYLRFSSQEFTLNSLQDSIHLTNNSIQKHCKNGERSVNLPEHNMWSLADFKDYLKSSGNENVWESVYEGMKKCVIAVIQSSLVDTEIYQKTFELYGCDFMLNEEYEPYLIEVNSSPDMSPSTIVTKRMCPMVLEDLLKVVVDLPKRSRASTGNFERIFTIPVTKVSSYVPGLLINGTVMKIHKENEE